MGDSEARYHKIAFDREECRIGGHYYTKLVASLYLTTFLVLLYGIIMLGLGALSALSKDATIMSRSASYLVESSPVWTPTTKVSQELQDSVDYPLYNLADLGTVRTWNYGEPTLVQAGRFTARNAWQEAGTFWNQFQERFPMFQSVDLSGLAIFGGCIVDMLLGQLPRDIDLVYFNDQGTPEEQGHALAERVNRFVTDIYDSIKRYNYELKRKKDGGIPIDGSTSLSRYTPLDMEELLVTRYKNTYTIKVPSSKFCSVPIQITHQSNLTDLLSKIDISCTAIAYYKGEIVMPERAKQALESLAFEINACDNSERYLQRVERYFSKGFDVILPGLNISKLHTRNLAFGLTEVLDLPYFRAFYTGIRGNKIETTRCEVTNTTTDKVCFGLDGYSGRNEKETGVGELIHRNIRHLVHSEFDEFTYIGQGDTYRQAFIPDLLITERMLTNTYETVGKKLFKGQALNLCKIDQYFPCRNMTHVLHELVLDFARDREDKEIYASNAFDDHARKYLEQLVIEQIAAAKEIIGTLKGAGSLAIKSILAKDTTCTAAAWYGPYSKIV